MAKFTGVPETRLAVVALVMLLVSADANTSAGAPAVNWVTQIGGSGKVERHRRSWVLGLEVVPISVNVAFSDAAAKTVSVPAAGATEAAALDKSAELVALELGAADELAAAEPAAELVVEGAVVLPELQLTTTMATHRPVRAATVPRNRMVECARLTNSLRGFDDHRGRFDHGHGHGQPAGFELQLAGRLTAHQRHARCAGRAAPRPVPSPRPR